MKNAIIEMQNHLDTMTMRMDKAEERISDTEDKIKDNNEAEKKRERKVLDRECRLRYLSDSLKHRNIPNVGVPEEEEREKGAEVLCKQIIANNSLNLRKDTDIESQEAQNTPIIFNKCQPSPSDIIVKLTESVEKERILKATRWAGVGESLTY